MAKTRGMYPAPVYEAHFADGSVRRMSFFQIPGKPWDFERGARLCAACGRGVSFDHYHRLGVVEGPAHPAIVDGYVWHNDKVDDAPLTIVRDPRFAGQAAPFYSCAVDGESTKKRANRVTAADLRSELKMMIRYAECLRIELENRGHDFSRDVTLDKARELLAA